MTTDNNVVALFPEHEQAAPAENEPHRLLESANNVGIYNDAVLKSMVTKEKLHSMELRQGIEKVVYEQMLHQIMDLAVLDGPEATNVFLCDLVNQLCQAAQHAYVSENLGGRDGSA